PYLSNSIAMGHSLYNSVSLTRPIAQYLMFRFRESTTLDIISCDCSITFSLNRLILDLSFSGSILLSKLCAGLFSSSAISNELYMANCGVVYLRYRKPAVTVTDRANTNQYQFVSNAPNRRLKSNDEFN